MSLFADSLLKPYFYQRTYYGPVQYQSQYDGKYVRMFVETLESGLYGDTPVLIISPLEREKIIAYRTVLYRTEP